MNDPTTDLRWRADIEGLRALAILSVVADHAGLPFAQGGFVGVDIFFVLSGYLITGLLLRELAEKGSINFTAFYARRLQRLLPGLALMVLVTALAAALLLAPFEQIPQAVTGSLAFLWLSNFHFGMANFGYFDAGSANDLFLHTWSLGVEEQFYLVWPLLILWLFLTTGVSRNSRHARLSRGLMFVGLAGLAINFLLSATSPLWAFYSMPSRSWQFALGALVYIHVDALSGKGADNSGVMSTLEAWRTQAGWIGATLILGSVVLMHERMTYPGYWALIPSAGAALVIYSGAGSERGFANVLTIAPLRYLGRVSYSWYLWHWPVFVLGNMLQPGAGLIYQLVLVFTSLLLAIAAYALVEQPIRGSGWLRAQPAYMLTGAICVMLAGAAMGPVWESAAAIWTTRPDQIAYLQLRSDLPMLYAEDCDERYFNPRVQECVSGAEEAANTVVFFGDSISLQWFSAIAPHFARQGWQIIVMTKSSCPLVDEPVFYEVIGEEYVVCEQWRNAAVARLTQLKPDALFMGSSVTYDFTPEQWREGSARILAPLAATAGRVYLIRGTPRLRFDGLGCLARQEWQAPSVAAYSSCASQAPTKPDDEVLAALQAAAAPFDNVRILDFNSLVCPDGHCQASVDGRVVFRDFQHIANSYAAALQWEVGNVITAAR